MILRALLVILPALSTSALSAAGKDYSAPGRRWFMALFSSVVEVMG